MKQKAKKHHPGGKRSGDKNTGPTSPAISKAGGLGASSTAQEEEDTSLSMDHVLGSCSDFVNETTALQAMIEARGHILAMSPKGHCELAGDGIEYDWGRSKQNFRRGNTGDAASFHELILWSIARENLTLSTSRKFSRVARAYRRAYWEGVDNDHTSIERMTKTYKTHRNAFDFAKKLIQES